MTYPIVDWHGLYGEGWADDIVPEAFSHPAKYSRALIRHIYAYLIEHKLIERGATVLDPFGGVALGALDAQLQGLHWIGCELEPKFVALGNANLALWDTRYRPHFPRFGTARLVQGDSRKLAEVIKGTLGGLVSSPPFMEVTSDKPSESIVASGLRMGQSSMGDGYGTSPGQLGAMPSGNVEAILSSPPYDAHVIRQDVDSNPDGHKQGMTRGHHAFDPYGESAGQLGAMPSGDYGAVIASPPYAESLQGDNGAEATRKRIAEGKFHGQRPDVWTSDGQMSKDTFGGGYSSDPNNLGNLKGDDFSAVIASPPFLQASGGAEGRDTEGAIDKALLERHRAGNAGAKGYGESEGQLQNMREGDVDAIIASPPFTGVMPTTGDPNYAWKFHGDQSQYAEASPGQLASLPEGDVEAVVSSPPYEGAGVGDLGNYASPQSMPEGIGDLFKAAGGNHKDYGNAEGQLGGEVGDSFWSASLAIVSQCYALLAPGGVAVWVCKDYVRNKKRVPFSDQWRMLCEKVGFVTLTEARAWVVEDNGTQLGMMETEDKSHRKERKSFFRRLAEKKGSPRIDYETVWIMRKESA